MTFEDNQIQTSTFESDDFSRSIEARQLAPDLVQLDQPVYRAQQMIGRNTLLHWQNH